jgi:hypothetical protein
MEIELNNKPLLTDLNNFIDDFFGTFQPEDAGICDPLPYVEYGEQYCSEQCLREQMLPNADEHVGFPEHYYGLSIQALAKHDPLRWLRFDKLCRKDWIQRMGAHTSALSLYYPPGGFVGWHTNWNANAYQLLLTWSRDGDGYFRYYDQHTDTIVTQYDKPGWQARWYYFGRKDEPEHHCWHTAYTKGDRMTFAFKFGANHGLTDLEKDRKAQMMRDAAIEELESEY